MNVTDLISAVLAHAPAAPDPLVARLLVEASREFCEETRYWVDDNITADTIAGEATYAPVLPAGATVVDVQEVEHNGKLLTPTTPTKANRDHGVTWRTATGTPVGYLRAGNAAVRVVPAPVEPAVAALRFTLELKPAIGATVLNDVFAEPYSETIVNGALARLFAISDKPWSSATQSARYLTLFYSKFAEASSKAENNRTRNVPRKVTYRD